ncbi:hypothetical protein QBC35DRAFT_512933 [Podospora australis]|uniref:Uncharacterized protein n=1 Tax=Podospora australis TaxID=1536484 RepID=A0AAN6X0E5_9PEZI|nr:hypothetical protein QBC35DRAFT_512933 [Podospora australis]
MDTSTRSPDPSKALKAVKDKECQFCHQAFTSSSLGRHLDLFIREHNPREDGVHDVEIIKEIRRGITRRRPKASAGRRDTSLSIGTPTVASRKSHGSSVVSEDAEPSAANTPVSQVKTNKVEGGIGRAREYPFNTPWEATGVINDIGASVQGRGAGQTVDSESVAGLPRPPNRQALKQQLDAKQKIQDAMDTAKAAELALREIIGSFRAAKQQVDVDSMPFDFDPLSLDFPALTLHCLEPPPTLFASTQHPTSTSWSILPPGPVQLEALRTYFKEEFRKFKIACAAATTAVNEDLTYPPSNNPVKSDSRDDVRKAERKAIKMEQQVFEHIEATYAVWERLSSEERGNLWRLEMARSIGRRQKEVMKLKESRNLVKQENIYLKTQIEHLNRLQQPREFKITPPSLLYMDEKTMNLALEEGLASTNTRKYVGLNIADRHSDTHTITTSAIERWKNVIRATRTGLPAQRPLEPQARPGQQHPVRTQQSTPSHHGSPHLSPAPMAPMNTDATSTTQVTTPSAATAVGTPSMAHTTANNADEDSDCEMNEGDVPAPSEADAASDASGDDEADADADGEIDAMEEDVQTTNSTATDSTAHARPSGSQ